MQEIEQYIHTSGLDSFLHAVFAPVPWNHPNANKGELCFSVWVIMYRYPTILTLEEGKQTLLLISIQHQLQYMSKEMLSRIHNIVKNYQTKFANSAVTKLLLRDCEYFLSIQDMEIDYNTSYMSRDWNPLSPIHLFEEDRNPTLSQQSTTKQSISESLPTLPTQVGYEGTINSSLSIFFTASVYS